MFNSLASGQLNPEIYKVFALDEMTEAHCYMESNQQTRKVLVKL
ncbi:zinc-binding dehydrogenase [Actinobacillus ureae]|nr:zinc-binding dehydrogenase [Actinobacillus ureae]